MQRCKINLLPVSPNLQHYFVPPVLILTCFTNQNKLPLALYSSVLSVSLFICLTVQLASGAFGHIKDTVLSALNREPTMDISPETVGTLSLIMLAQAQEVFFLKATSGTKAQIEIVAS